MIDLKFFIVLLITVSVSKSINIINIDGWDLEYKEIKYSVPAISGIFTVARSNNLIEKDLFYKYNTKDYHWLADNTCHYSTNISDGDFADYENVNLVLEGVDLFSTIKINGISVGTTDNMFVRYIINIPKEIQRPNNVIELLLTSPLKGAEKLHEERKGLYRIPPYNSYSEFNGDPYVNLIRKMQASFAWDWGPAVPSIGIWKPVYIEAYNESVIRDVITHVLDNNDTHWELLIDIYFAENTKKYISGNTKVSILSMEQSTNMSISPNEYAEYIFSTKLAINKSLVEMWWPNGYGLQQLYDLNILFTNKEESSSKTVRIGFRTIKLVQDTIPNGLTFYFMVNNLPIFIKGSNLVPIDIRPELGQDKEKVRKLLSIARDQHMNMIRVWGGGVYESDYLYDLADEYGILIWQDFMFACALYPATETFLSNVLDEVRTQVKRIYHHPCIALFAGNNENEGALMNNWFGVYDDRYKEDYKKLYIDTIKAEYVRLTRNNGIFVTSSASNGLISDNTTYGLSDQPGSIAYGDAHVYMYYEDTFDSSIYPISRFTSEYGFQSLPCAESFLKDTNNETDLSLNSNFMEFRQHHGSGYSQILNIIGGSLELPRKNIKHYNNVVIYYSQITQAFSMKLETERLRNYRSIFTRDGRGGTMGALYWQFNDVWTAPSWSGIDFYGRWKMLQYFVYDVFCPIIITGELTVYDTKILKVFVVTDVDSIESAEASIQLYKYSSLESIYEKKISVSLEHGNSKIIHTITDVDNYTREHKCYTSSCFIHVKLSKDGEQLAPDNYILLDRPKNCHLPHPKVQITSIKKGSSDNSFLIEVSTDMVALFVWLDAHEIDGRFSENGFLQVQAHRQVIFYCEGNVSDDEMKGNLTVTHLRDEKYFPK